MATTLVQRNHHAEAVALIELYAKTVGDMLTGKPPTPDFVGWADTKFHQFLTRQVAGHHRRFIETKAQADKYDGVCELFSKLDGAGSIVISKGPRP